MLETMILLGGGVAQMLERKTTKRKETAHKRQLERDHYRSLPPHQQTLTSIKQFCSNK